MNALSRFLDNLIRNSIALLSLTLMLLVPFILMSCDSLNPCIDEEIIRSKSPDGKVDFVMMQRDCGATTSFTYKIFIVPSGSAIENEKPVFEADKMEGESIEWKGSKLLLIKYKKARIFHFKNFWQARVLDNFQYIVDIQEIRLEEGIE